MFGKCLCIVEYVRTEIKNLLNYLSTSTRSQEYAVEIIKNTLRLVFRGFRLRREEKRTYILFLKFLQFVIADSVKKYLRNFPLFSIMKVHFLVLRLIVQTGVWKVTTILLNLLQNMSCRKTLRKRSQIMQRDKDNDKSTGE
jgi:hypothetical protein